VAAELAVIASRESEIEHGKHSFDHQLNDRRA
jgi:hypothetical protein